MNEYSLTIKEAIKKIEYNEQRGCCVSTSSFLEILGAGKRATVFKVKNEALAIKVFHPGHKEQLSQEVRAYQMLDIKNPYFAHLHDFGENYLVLDYVKGKTLADCLRMGTYIEEKVIAAVDEGLMYAKERGLNPSDVHIKNILWDEESGKTTIVDLEGFVRSGKCVRWDKLKNVYYKFYIKKWFPKKWALLFINLGGSLYRKAEYLSGNRQKKNHFL